MKNKMKLEKQVSIITALDVAIVFLVIVLLIAIMITRTSFKEATTVFFGEDSFSYAIEDKNYSELVRKYYDNISMNGEENPKLLEYYGVAKYYEAASLYKAYDTVGNTDKAHFYQKKMQEYEKDMGGWSIAKPDILKSLEIEE